MKNGTRFPAFESTKGGIGAEGDHAAEVEERKILLDFGIDTLEPE